MVQVIWKQKYIHSFQEFGTCTELLGGEVECVLFKPLHPLISPEFSQINLSLLEIASQRHTLPPPWSQQLCILGENRQNDYQPNHHSLMVGLRVS